MSDNVPSATEFRAGRADSTSSTNSSGSWTSDSKSGRQQPFRRTSHPLFESLTAQKRRDDPASIARRQSLSEQRPKPGFFGQMWNAWVRGEK
ncbi:hypothetical protein VTH82DRAFT_2986 [Thermothelomyces myriococcoides]